MATTGQDTLQVILEAKDRQQLTFASLAALLPQRNEVSAASLLLSRHPPPSEEELEILVQALSINYSTLKTYFSATPDRGLTAQEMPPREPLIYRLYEVILNYGKAYKAVMNEMFGDGIMSAIAFTTKVEKEIETDPATGVQTTWAVVTLRGKWLPYSKF